MLLKDDMVGQIFAFVGNYHTIPNMPQPHLTATAISRCFKSGETTVSVVNNVSLQVDAREFVALVGPSGCGKTSLLSILGLIDKPSSGALSIASQPIDFSDDAQLLSLRRTEIGFVFQQFNLLPTLTVTENVVIPLLLKKLPGDPIERAHQFLRRVGLQSREHAYPSQLSGGEMQRVACVRALIHSPKIILADEPTGNLDSHSGELVLQLLREFADEGTSVVMATHSPQAERFASRVLRMKDGVIES